MFILQLTALNLIAPSTFMIFKGCAIFATLFFSKFLIHLVIRKIHVVSCVTSFVGLLIVGVSDLAFDKS